MTTLRLYAKKNGFTLIEILVVVTILGVLAGIGLQNFRVSQAKSRDAKRKADLEQIQRALELYYNDKGKYPETLSFGNTLQDEKGSIYMKEIPNDPLSNKNYCYIVGGNYNYYKIYSVLENKQDPKYRIYNCNGKEYNYGVSSSNTSP